MEQENIPNDQIQTKSVSASNLPETFIVDKQVAKEFFSQFGTVKRIIFRPKRLECTVEYETIESAQQALNYQANFKIFPTPQKPATPEPEFLNPDVQSELDLMYPSGIRTQAKPGMETFIRNPQALMKPRILQALKSKTEPLSISVSVDSKLVNAARVELENLLRKPARTAEEKLQVLDTRDKLYRLIVGKTTDINKAPSTKGTCKDMCPEKERIMREARLQVASFEVSDQDSSMDPRKAIKQYSRSAADAETPLPHELRPESSLKTSMTYLLHMIMNLCDDDRTSIGDWYHFVWDRTRGIRKDITQQELCSPVTVDLVEQCVRFHVHCSARLIAEDPAIFDQKINTENLTKCLQTLKYMYNDLKVKNVKCKNEAEFRAYVVLLNLNESGNFLWEIKQLEKSILNSKEVRYALDVYFAVANNNYVKFFNLVRETSYMNACILLRYFTQVRIKAINIIMKSYTPRKGSFNYNISYLQEILAFEDFESTVTFLGHHGLVCDTETDVVFLDRSMFGAGETSYQMERAYQLVESKMETSVAEVVCGNLLPSSDCFINLIPHSSFDKDGFLKRESFYAEDQNGPLPIARTENIFKIPKGSPPVSPGRSMLQQKFQPQKSADQSDVVINENPFNKPTNQNPFATTKTISQSPKNIFKTTETKSKNPFAQKMSFGQPQSQTTAQSIFGPSLTSPSSFSLSKQLGISKEQETPKQQLFGMPSSATVQQSHSNFSFSTISQQNNQEIEMKKREEKEAAEKKRKMEEEEERKAKAEEAERLRRLKKEMEEREEREEMERLEAERLRLQEELRIQEEIEKAKEEALEKASQEVLNSLINEIIGDEGRKKAHEAMTLYVKIPEDFYDALEFDVVAEELCKIYQQELFAYINETKLKYETLHSCFQRWRETTLKEIERRDKLSTIGCSIVNLSLDEQADNLHHPEQNVTLSNMKQYLSGSPQSIHLPDLNNFKTINLTDELKLKTFESKRLQNILDNLELPVPVSVIVYKNLVLASDEDEIREHMDLTTEVNVSSFEINLYYECHEKEKNLTETTIEACQFLYDSYADLLVDKKYQLFDLQAQHILDFFQTTIGDEMWRRVEISCRQSDEFTKRMSEFNNVVQFYNLCIDKLMEMVTNDFRKMPSLPDEFRERLKPMNQRIPSSYEYFPVNWQSLDYSRKQVELIHSLKLIKMQNDSFKNFDDFKQKLLSFLTLNIAQHTTKVYQSVIGKVINFFYTQNLYEYDDVNEALVNFCWLKIIGEIVIGKFNEMFSQRHQEIPSMLIYNKKDFHQYQHVPWWYKINFIPSHDGHRSEEQEPHSKRTKLTQPTKDEIEFLLKKSSTSLNKVNKNIEAFKEVSNKTRDVSKDFDKFLNNFEKTFTGKMTMWEKKFESD
ncbi:CLUMA_CG014928, isoform A [Clunio marinus]|uniref:CLUMA_CG014928, isoform A n=1 Tax=Clunio marinus TaxID=568069 RepID=A0A1J1INI0_9DIPT|nr:CLUMA_CG014928, isoform A [Clunio marinus]